MIFRKRQFINKIPGVSAICSHLMISPTSPRFQTPQENAAKLFDEADLNKDGMSLGDFNDYVLSEVCNPTKGW